MKRFLWPSHRVARDILIMAILGAAALPAFVPAHQPVGEFDLSILPSLAVEMAQLSLGVYVAFLIPRAFWQVVAGRARPK